jgi:hypothetical protein
MLVTGSGSIRKGHRAMSNLAPTFSTVRISFDPYNHEQVQQLLSRAYQEFGRDKTRWYCVHADLDDVDKNVWVLDFKFRFPHDATIFSLKYL